MIPLIGLLVSFYVAMRGVDWIVVSKEARLTSTYYGRCAVGVFTVLGAILFGSLIISSSVDATIASNYSSELQN
jgi:hypothetical protein